MLETSAKGAQPRGEEAQRVLSTFAASLKNPTLVSWHAYRGSGVVNLCGRSEGRVAGTLGSDLPWPAALVRGPCSGHLLSALFVAAALLTSSHPRTFLASPPAPGCPACCAGDAPFHRGHAELEHADPPL